MPSPSDTEPEVWTPRRPQRQGRYIAPRLLALLIAGVLISVLAIAVWLKPDPRGHGTHEQLGLPPCTFSSTTGVECPSCGMTTSFAHVVRGQFADAFRANPVGVVLAVMCGATIPWLLACAYYGRVIGIRDGDIWTARLVIGFLIVSLLCWGTRLGVRWWDTGTIITPEAPVVSAEDSGDETK